MINIDQKKIVKKNCKKIFDNIKVFYQLHNLPFGYRKKIKYYSLWGKINNVIKVYNYYLLDLKKQLSDDKRFKNFPFRLHTLYANFLVSYIDELLDKWKIRKKISEEFCYDLSDHEIDLRIALFALKTFFKNKNDPDLPVEYREEYNYKNMCSFKFIPISSIFNLKCNYGSFVFNHVYYLKKKMIEEKYVFTDEDLLNINEIEKRC